MEEVKWIKIVVDIFDDEKILLIESLPDGDSIIVCWFKLLCLAGKQNNSGVFILNDRIPYTEEMFATIFRRPLQTVRLALKTFEEFGMIEIINGTVTIPNWGKHQKLEGAEKIRAQTKERVRRYREKQKELSGVTLQLRDVTHPELEEELEGELEEDNKKKKKRFTPPTEEDVRAYCNERNNGIDPGAFVDFYASKNWMVGKDKMSDWKAAVRTWERRRKENGNGPNGVSDKPQTKKYNLVYDA